MSEYSPALAAPSLVPIHGESEYHSPLCRGILFTHTGQGVILHGYLRRRGAGLLQVGTLHSIAHATGLPQVAQDRNGNCANRTRAGFQVNGTAGPSDGRGET